MTRRCWVFQTQSDRVGWTGAKHLGISASGTCGTSAAAGSLLSLKQSKRYTITQVPNQSWVTP